MIKKSVEWENTGQIYTVWQVTHAQADFVAGGLEFHLHGWIDEAGKSAGKRPVLYKLPENSTEPRSLSGEDLAGALEGVPGGQTLSGLVVAEIEKWVLANWSDFSNASIV